MTPPVPPDSGALRLRLELDRLRAELAGWQARESELRRREQQLADEQGRLRETRLASLNLIEDAVAARNDMAQALDALRGEVQARQRAEAEALRERDLQRKVLDSLPGVFYLIDGHGHFIHWNRGFEQVTGYTAEEIAGMRPLDFFGSAADRERVAACIEQVFSEGQSDVEAGFTGKDGHSTPYYFNGRRILIDGEPCLVGMGIDISERLRTEAARTALERQLRESQKMEAVGTLAGGIAHDFNNILAGMLGQLTLVGDMLEGSHPARGGLDQVRRGAVRARKLVQQILAFSRRSPPELQAQPLRPLVEEALAMLRATLPAHVALEARLTDTAPCARVDATQIEQVLLNLGTNAWHALGGERGWIEVGLDERVLSADDALVRSGKLAPGPYAQITVSDNGVGMDAPTLARVFEPFFTTKPVGSGTGLGLSVAHGIVTAHGGAVEVRSEPGRGTAFTILLPAVEAAEASASGFAGLEDSPSGRGERVLYIDDDETVALVVGALLERGGFRAISLGDGASAVEALRNSPGAFDLVLTDYNMPGMSGLDVARAVRSINPALPVIVSSGHVDEALQREAAALQVDAVLNKERLVEDMVPLVTRVLDRQSAA